MLIIKGADFSNVAIDTVEPSVEYEDITSKLHQGFITTQGRLFSTTGSYNKYVTALEDETSYLVNSQDVEWFVPGNVYYRAWALGGSSPAIVTPAQGCDGIIGDGTQVQTSVTNIGTGTDVTISEQWLTSSDIYRLLEVSANDYPMCGLNLSISQTQPVTVEEIKQMGVKVRRVI